MSSLPSVDLDILIFHDRYYNTCWYVIAGKECMWNAFTYTDRKCITLFVAIVVILDYYQRTFLKILFSYQVYINDKLNKYVNVNIYQDLCLCEVVCISWYLIVVRSLSLGFVGIFWNQWNTQSLLLIKVIELPCQRHDISWK